MCVCVCVCVCVCCVLCVVCVLHAFTYMPCAVSEAQYISGTVCGNAVVVREREHDVVEAHATVANFLSRYCEHFS